MPRYRRLPVEIDAELFDPDDNQQHARLGLRNDTESGRVVIHTLEGDMRVSPGDWIITGVLGERYPCKPKAFDKTYEKVMSNVTAE